MKKTLIIIGILLSTFGIFRTWQAHKAIENYSRITQYEKGFLLGAVAVFCVGILVFVIGLRLKKK